MSLDPTGGRERPHPVPQRAYIRRRGRMTAGQSRALAELGRFRLPHPGDRLDPDVVFRRSAPLGVEIGFGMGHALLDWARARPDLNLLGIEIYQAGIGALLLGLEREGIDNVRVLEAPAEAVLAERLAPGSVDEIRIFFPDPWPKKRHWKRRLIQPAFVALLADCLRPGGQLWLATDWVPYAEWMTEVLAGEPRLTALSATELATAALAQSRLPTRFEARGARLGHAIRDLRYRRNP